MQDSLTAPRQAFPTLTGALSEAEAFLRLHDIDTARLDAEVLLGHALAIARTQLYARLSTILHPDQQERFWGLIQRRAAREPLSYITGEREFWSLSFRVTPDVLIPRPETELLVETTLRLLSQSPRRHHHSPIHLLDIGTGSGCVAIALAKELPRAELWAVDISRAALTVAQENAQRHGVAGRIHFLQGDLFSPMNKERPRFDVIVSNPPYIAHASLATLQPEVRDWEPRTALDGGADGLDFYRRLVEESSFYLHSSGWLVMEIGVGQSSEVLRFIQMQRNFEVDASVQDYAGHERIVVASRV
jgi:release factor glutamine methyltransferase